MPTPARMTVPAFRAAKSQRRLAMVTAYDWLWAGICDEAGVDAILVGDTLGMVVQGRSTTLPVTLRDMIYHAQMVCRGVQRALVVVDLPFLSYQVSPRQAIRNAGEILKRTEAAAVKLEGGVQQAATIRALTEAQIPVMAHVGLQPQAVRALGSMSKIQREHDQLLADAKAAEEAGAFAIVVELVSQQIASEITSELSIPTIGIGSGPHCDGQVLVSTDMLGLNTGFHPRFLKRYAELRSTAVAALSQYAAEVRTGSFPGPEHSHQ